MKLSIKKIILPLVCAGVCVSAQAASLDAAKLERTMTEQVRLQQARVQITLYWEKEVRRRAHRGGVRSVQNQTQRAKTTCQGILLEGNVKVAAPASCFEHEDFSLYWVELKFTNGKKASGLGDRVVSIQGDLAYILVKRKATEGLIGVPFVKLKDGESLQDAFGENMTTALHQFYSSFGVRFKAPRCRIGSSVLGRRSSSLTVGEPVIYRGKLVALVNKVPRIYGTLFGGVSESALAVFRY